MANPEQQWQVASDKWQVRSGCKLGKSARPTDEPEGEGVWC